MKEFTFCYEVITTATNVVIAEANCGLELTEEQEDRLCASFQSGQYRCMDEDAGLNDICQKVLAAALEAEKGTEYAAHLGTEVQISHFQYPEECKMPKHCGFEAPVIGVLNLQEGYALKDGRIVKL